MSDQEEYNGKKNGPAQPYFSRGAEDSTASYGGADVGPGGRIGPFKLLGVLGEGGYGIVYLAAQERPIRRRVALKVVKPGMDSKQVIARFEAERQALALLDHSNIAQIHDAGTTPQGLPYFVMEHIQGIPITEYCDRERLTLRERLELFLQVCSAIQHAHQKGIIHRDLKPSNILVTVQDGKPLVKVIDFGIAKALAQPLTEQTLYTEQGQLIGTPDYMSPEQAEMDARGVDTRSDVYSLGVVLYELLTGMLPFDPDALRAGGLDHIRATIREQEPRTPSTRLTGLGEELTKIAQCRRTDPQTLTRSLRRELEWIPLRAMRKEGSRRYQSAAELAYDIENYLKGAPLLAGPESVLYRTKKFAQRHAGTVVATVIVLTVLVTGLIVSTRMYFTAENARREAVQARTAEQEQRQLADNARAEAEKRLADLYENQGRHYVASGEYDKALVFLSEAYTIDGRRLSVRLSLLEGLRKHGDPNFRHVSIPAPWQGITTDGDLPFCVSPSRTLIAFVDSTSNAIFVQRTDTGEQVNRLQASDVLNLAFTPDDRHLIAKTHESDEYHHIKAFHIKSDQEVFSTKRQNVDIDRVHQMAGDYLPDRHQIESTYNGILISPSGNWFAFVDVMGAVEDLRARVCLWDFAANVLRTVEEGFKGQQIIGIAYRTPSAYGHTDGLLIVDRERVVHSFAAPGLTFEWRYFFGLTSATFSADGTRMTFAQEWGTELVDRRSNRPVRQFPGRHMRGFSPEGRYAITERTDITGTEINSLPGRIEIWDAREGAIIAGLRCAEVQDLHFAPDSQHMVTEHGDQGIRVWSLKDFTCAISIPGKENQKIADISTDGRWLVTNSPDNAAPVRLYDLRAAHFFEPYECRTAERSLSDGWAGMSQDIGSSSSHFSSGQLPLFNEDDSFLITGGGLWAFAGDDEELRSIPALVKAYVPLRLEEGNIRPASPSEMLQAKADYATLVEGPQATETIRYLLQIAERKRAAGELDEVMELLMSLIPTRSSLDADSAYAVQELTRELSDDFIARGEPLERQGQYESALSDYETAARLDASDPRPFNALAWLLATCPNMALRSSHDAIEYAKKARALLNEDNRKWCAIYAAACAADGNWPAAVAYQEKAIALLSEAEERRLLANYSERLRLYRLGRCYERQEFLHFPGDDLAARWSFDEQSTSYPLSTSAGGRLVRLSWGAKTLGTPGGIVLSLWGDGGCAACGPLQLPEPIGAITVAVWAKWDDAKGGDAYPTVISWGHSWTLHRSPQTGTIVFQCGGLYVPVNAPESRVVGQTPLLNDGKWHHFVGSYDGARLCIYVDGNPDGIADATGVISDGMNNVWAGRGQPSYTPWKGMVDDIRVYNVALEASEINRLYHDSRTRYDNLFYVDVGDTLTIALPTDKVQARASVTTDTGTLSPDQFRVSWTSSRGPETVQFIPGDHILDPYVTFRRPGIYELRCTVERNGLEAHNTLPVVVYPVGFDGLVAHYTFDRGDASDSTGQGIDGLLKGDACVVNDAQRGSVLRLDGDGDYVDCGIDPRFDINTVMTITAWVKTATLDRDHQTIVAKGDSAWQIHRHLQTDRLRFACGGMEGLDTWSGPIGATPVNDRRWHHVVGVCDGTHMILYVDGRPDSVAEVSGNTCINSEPVLIGENSERTRRYWNGWIDDIRIYNRALSPDEVAHLYEQTK